MNPSATFRAKFPDPSRSGLRVSLETGVAHASPEDEHPLPPMGGANVRRRAHRPLRIEPEVGQVTDDASEGPPVIDGKKPSHVLQEDVARSHVANDADDLRPEPTLVFHAAPGAGCAGWLAREACNDAIHRSTEGGSGELPDVAHPERRTSHAERFMRASQNRGAKRFPLDHADDASSDTQVAESGNDAAFESADAGEESQDGEVSHTAAPLPTGAPPGRRGP